MAELFWLIVAAGLMAVEWFAAHASVITAVAAVAAVVLLFFLNVSSEGIERRLGSLANVAAIEKQTELELLEDQNEALEEIKSTLADVRDEVSHFRDSVDLK